jgi:hypothetical protein
MRTITVCAAGIALIAFALWFRPADADDFGPFYRAASLASAHRSVYADPSWSPKKNAEGRFLPYLRIPSYAAALRPFAALPYEMARRVWIAALIFAVVACVRLFPVGRNRLAMALAFSFPLADALMVGQDTIFVLLIVLAAARIFSGGREFLAGLIASLLAVKMTWLPAAAMVFLEKSRRGTWGLLTGMAVQLAISFAVGGMGWPAEYLALLRNPLLDPEPGRMLSIRAVAVSLSLPAAVYPVAGVVLYLGFWFACKRLSLADGLTIALALGLIASPHCKVYDAVVLIPLFVKVASLNSWVGVLAYFGLAPVLYVVVLAGPPPILPIGTSLVVVTTLAAAVRLYKMREVQVLPRSPALA